MKHALVIGGTGMLSNVCLWLLENNYKVSVIGRNSNKMEKLIQNSIHSSRIIPILVDYEDDKELGTEIKRVIEEHGSFDLIVAWIHSPAKNALPTICEIVGQTSVKWQLYHILGSSQNLKELKKNISLDDNCTYHQIQLGFILESSYSRWLSNNEISEGVIEAISQEKERHIVGQIEPWDKRP